MKIKSNLYHCNYLLLFFLQLYFSSINDLYILNYSLKWADFYCYRVSSVSAFIPLTKTQVYLFIFKGFRPLVCYCNITHTALSWISFLNKITNRCTDFYSYFPQFSLGTLFFYIYNCWLDLFYSFAICLLGRRKSSSVTPAAFALCCRVIIMV